MVARRQAGEDDSEKRCHGESGLSGVGENAPPPALGQLLADPDQCWCVSLPVAKSLADGAISAQWAGAGTVAIHKLCVFACGLRAYDFQYGGALRAGE